MLKIGLTGNIGSGKSTVSSVFETLGIKVFNADNEAKNLYFEENVKQDISTMLGNKVLDKNNNIDFKLLAGIIFNDENKLKQLTSYIHPLVVKKYENWLISKQDLPFTIHESAIIYEYSLQNKFDFVICVSAPYELRLHRVMKRDNSIKSEIEARMNNQMDEKTKIKNSDFVIVNDEKSFIIPQVIDIYENLISQE